MQIYIIPESSQKGDLHLYRALDFPLEWRIEKVIFKKLLVETFLIHYDENYWLFGLDITRFGAIKNGELEIWYANSPLGP